MCVHRTGSWATAGTDGQPLRFYLDVGCCSVVCCWSGCCYNGTMTRTASRWPNRHVMGLNFQLKLIPWQTKTTTGSHAEGSRGPPGMWYWRISNVFPSHHSSFTLSYIHSSKMHSGWYALENRRCGGPFYFVTFFVLFCDFFCTKWDWGQGDWREIPSGSGEIFVQVKWLSD